MRTFQDFVAYQITLDEGIGDFVRGVFGIQKPNPRAAGSIFKELLAKVGGDEEKANQIYDQAVKISGGTEHLVKHFLRRFITFNEPVPQNSNFLTDPRAADAMRGATVAPDMSRADLRTFRGRDQGGVAGVHEKPNKLAPPKPDMSAPSVAPAPTPPKQNPWKSIRGGRSS